MCQIAAEVTRHRDRREREDSGHDVDLLYSSGRRESHQIATQTTATDVPKNRCAEADGPLNAPSAKCM